MCIRDRLCSVHLQREICNRVRPKDKRAISSKLSEVFRKNDPKRTVEDGVEDFAKFAKEWHEHYPFLSKIADGERIHYYFTYLKYDVVVRWYIHSTNWIERFNRQIKKGATYKCDFPSVDSALHLVGSIALNSSYLGRRIGDLIGGLKKL